MSETPRPHPSPFNSTPFYIPEDFGCPTCGQPPRHDCVITRGPLEGEPVGSRMDDEGDIHESEDTVPHKPRQRLCVEAQRALDADWGRLRNWWGSLPDEQHADLLPLTEGDLLPIDYLTGLVDHGVVVAGSRWVSSSALAANESGVVVYHLLGLFLDQQRRMRAARDGDGS